MRQATILRVAGAAALLAGCASAATREATVAVAGAASAEDYRPYATAGTSVVEGQAVVSRTGGEVRLEGTGTLTELRDDVKTAARQEVTIDPATPYAMEWYRRHGTVLARFADVPADTMFRRARRVTIADDRGRFRFEGLPAGRYIIRTRITWQVPRSSMQTEQRGGVASAVVDVAAGERKQVTINGFAQPQ